MHISSLITMSKYWRSWATVPTTNNGSFTASDYRVQKTTWFCESSKVLEIKSIALQIIYQFIFPGQLHVLWFWSFWRSEDTRINLFCESNKISFFIKLNACLFWSKRVCILLKSWNEILQLHDKNSVRFISKALKEHVSTSFFPP